MPEAMEIPQISKVSAGLFMIDSGFIVTLDESGNIEFTLNFPDKSKIGMNFLFENDDSGSQEITTKVNNNTVHIRCSNFSNMQGTGTTKPIKLGEHKGKTIYVGFWIYNLGKIKKVEYCFFMER